MATVTTALQFSGGKDSLACLYLWRDRLDETVVMWCNTGAAYPETVEQMRRIRSMVPHFLEIKSDQPAQTAAFGYPADVVPVLNTVLGQLCTGEDGFRIQSFMDCCRTNIWEPMAKAVKVLGITRVVRGQRGDERLRSPIKSGQIVEGVEYVFPLENWSKEKVLAYLKEVGADLPAYYESELTSRDCWSCTAYQFESRERVRNLPPQRREIVMARLQRINEAVRRNMPEVA